MLGIRGSVPELASPAPVPAVKTVDGVKFERQHPDPPPHAGRGSVVLTFPEGLKHQLRLPAGESFTLQVDAVPETVGSRIDFAAGLVVAKEVYPRWTAESMSSRTDNAALNALLEQATADIRLLCNQYETGIYPTAGVPLFAVRFGGDALLTASPVLHVDPPLAVGVPTHMAPVQRAQARLASCGRTCISVSAVWRAGDQE